MNDFEQRLAASMKNAVEHPVDLDLPANHRVAKTGVLAAVLVAASVVSVFLVTGGFNKSSDRSAFADAPVRIEVPTYEGRLPSPGTTGLATAPTAGGTGVLRIADNGCVTIHRAGLSRDIGLVLPSGSYALLSARPTTVTIPGRGNQKMQLVDGQRVSAGGTVWSRNAHTNNPCPNPASTQIMVQGIEARPATKPAAINLEGEWTVTALDDAAGRPVALTGTANPLRVHFDAGKLSGHTRCNGFWGDYRQRARDGRDLAIHVTTISANQCTHDPPLIMRLQAVRHATEQGGNLYLQDENWATIAILERVSTAPDARRQYEPCDGGSIRVYAKLGAALGSKGVRLTITRTAGEPCLLPTYPQKIEFSYRDALLSLPTRLDSSTRPAGSVVLAKGSPATAVLLWGNWCAPVVHNDKIEFRVGTRRFNVRGFVTSPNCGDNGGAPGGESLNIRNPITIGFYARGVERTSTSPAAVAK